MFDWTAYEQECEMSQRRWMLLAVISGLVSHETVWAHPGHAHAVSKAADRITLTHDRQLPVNHSVTTDSGSFVMSRDGIVQIRRADDTLVAIPIDKLSSADRTFVERRIEQIRQTTAVPILLAQTRAGGERKEPEAMRPSLARHFDPFVKLKAIQTRWDENYFYVESNGIPAHQMMVGIKAWQQQVPLPQKYVGDNAWQIPLQPVPAKQPAMTKDRFLRGAIAIAVNGVPIFNPLNNRGDDAYLFGELDEFGGHCGRGDDYHYHLAPVHLEETVGKGQPIAYALDGYPIYGYQDPKAPDFAPLDGLNGHKDDKGNYHYHATKTYPYLNGGFYGEVRERGGQVDPQPRAEPLRPALSPLRDARITGFEKIKSGGYRLTYDVRGKTGTVTYSVAPDGSATFEFVDTAGRQTTETYTLRRRGPGGPPPRPGDNPPRGKRPPPPQDRPTPR